MSTSSRVCILLIVIFTVRIFGLMLIVPVAALFMPHYLDYEPALLGWVLGIYGFMQALFQLPLGVLSDRIGRRAVVLIGLGLLVLGSLIAYSATTIYGVIIGRAIQGMGAIGSTVMAGIADQTAPHNRTIVMAALGACIGLSFLGSLILGPICAHWLGIERLFLLIAILAGMTGMLAVGLMPSMRPTQRLSLHVSVWWPIIRHPLVWRTLVGIWTMHAIYTALFSVLPAMLVADIGISVAQHWQFYTAAILLSLPIVIPAVGTVDRWLCGRWYRWLLIMIMFIGIVLLFYVPKQYTLMLIGLACFFAGFNFFESYLPALISQVAPEGARGMVMGVFSSCQFFGIFTGGMVSVCSHQFAFLVDVPMIILWLLAIWSIVNIHMLRPGIAVE